jgi:hypothetical protein
MKLLPIACLAVAVIQTAQPAAGTGPHHPKYKAVSAILQAKCVSCHNDNRHAEKVNLSTYAKLMASGEHGPIVIAGKPEKSNLVRYVNGEKQPRMPFKQAPLPPGEIATIRDWIHSGAKP